MDPSTGEASTETVGEERAALRRTRRGATVVAGAGFLIIVLGVAWSANATVIRIGAFVAMGPLFIVAATSERLRSLRGRFDEEQVPSIPPDASISDERLSKIVGITTAILMLAMGTAVCGAIWLSTPR
jgi:hypothetical protein